MGRKGKKKKKGAATTKPKASKGSVVKSSVPDDRDLPQKEAALFKQVVKFYETKQYKKGLKSADLILKRFANHGETLAMKGLILNYTGKKKEAHEFVKNGLRNDMKSHVCWHVYGLLHRHERNYEQAARSYKQALRLDPQNQQILRDLSLLQIQLRLLTGFNATRLELLQLKSNQRTNWITFAISHQLTGNLATCLTVLDSYIDTVDDFTKKSYKGSYQDSELMLYKNDVLIECGQIEEALTHLTGPRRPLFKDKLRWRERKGELLVRLGRFDEARPIWRALLRTNPENYEYHRHLQCCVLNDATFGAIPLTTGSVASGAMAAVVPSTPVDPLIATGQRALGLRLPAAQMLDGEGGLTDAQLASLGAMYDELNVECPKANSHRRIPLDFSQGDEFEARLAKYLQFALQRASASVFSDVKHALRIGSAAQRREKQLAAIAIVKAMVASIGSEGKFAGSDKVEPPTSLLFARMLLGQLYDASGRYAAALAVLTEAIAHSPTCVELYMVKAKVLKHCGSLTAAADLIDLGRKMDLGDRFVNSKTTKYLLRDDRVTQGVETIHLFTKTEGEYQSTLFDMQCMWYEIDRAESHERQSEWGPALKQFLALEKHMKDISEDQFDFHTYCIRKATLRAYMQMIRMQDHLSGHPFIQRAIRGAVRIYLRLVDNPVPPPTPEELEAEAKAAAEAKAKKVAEAAAKKKKAGKSAPKGEADGDDKADDDDPEGKKLVRVDALEEASKYAKLLLESSQASAADRLEGQMLAYEVAMRQGKELLALMVRSFSLELCVCVCVCLYVFSRLFSRFSFLCRPSLLRTGVEARHCGMRVKRPPRSPPSSRRAAA